VISLMDADLLDDWLGTYLGREEESYAQYSDISVLVCSWNLDASQPRDVLVQGQERAARESSLVRRTGHAPEIIVAAFQETVDLEDKKKTARTFLTLTRKKNKTPNATAHEKQHKLWQEAMAEAVLPVAYRTMVAQYMVGLTCLVFVRADVAAARVETELVEAQKVKTGFKGYHGNKGGLVARLTVDDTSLCFVVAHLAAGQEHIPSRNKDAATILDETEFRTSGTKFVHAAEGRYIADHHHVWFIGDLNYRIEGERNPLVSVWSNDQLVRVRCPPRPTASVHGRVTAAPALGPFLEGPLGFVPTYKYDPGSDEWDTSDKQRLPAWCDRILF
ncbi:Endonuclease/exonuclease/phosphatase, partial [Blastocladiella britannica]